MNGKIVGDHYFLGSHGEFTETTKAFYTYSLWHVRSFFLTVPLAFVGGFACYSSISSIVSPGKAAASRR